MKAIEVIGIVIMLVVIFALGSYGQGYYAQPMTFQQANAQFFAGMAQLEQEQSRQSQAEMNRLMALAQGGGVPVATGGGIIFPVNNPGGGFSAAVQQVNMIGFGCGDGSAELTQGTIRNYQNIAAQNQLAYQQLDRITEDVKKIRSGNYTQADVVRWQKQAENVRRVSAIADAYNSTYQMQSQELERDQKRAANRELYNSTGKEYWQYTNRPVTPGPEQDAYDRANQVYRRW